MCLAFLLRRDRGTQAGAGSPEQMTGRCHCFLMARYLPSLVPATVCHLSPALWGHRSALKGNGEQLHRYHANTTSNPHVLLVLCNTQHARKWKLFIFLMLSLPLWPTEAWQENVSWYQKLLFYLSLILSLTFSKLAVCLIFWERLITLTTNNYISPSAVLLIID